jgi:hypothetical protein
MCKSFTTPCQNAPQDRFSANRKASTGTGPRSGNPQGSHPPAYKTPPSGTIRLQLKGRHHPQTPFTPVFSRAGELLRHHRRIHSQVPIGKNPAEKRNRGPFPPPGEGVSASRSGSCRKPQRPQTGEDSFRWRSRLACRLGSGFPERPVCGSCKARAGSSNAWRNVEEARRCWTISLNLE